MIMKQNYIRLYWKRYALIAMGLILIPMIWLGAQVPQRTEILSHLVREGLSRWHYSGKQIDALTSRNAINEYIRFLDFGKRYLLSDDVALIQKMGQNLAGLLQSGDLSFVDSAAALVQKRMDEVWAFIDPLLKERQNLDQKDVFQFDSDKREYFTSVEEMQNYWRQFVRYRILLRMYEFWLEEHNGQAPKGSLPDQSDLLRLEEKSRKEVHKLFASYFKRIRDIQDEDRLGRFFNALLSVFDPHTAYFAPRDQEDFNIEMSGSFEGIGALLGERDDYVQVMQIIVGGPSWRDQRLEVGDKILKVGQGEEEPVDVAGIRVTDAVKLIRGKKGTKVVLIVKKPDGRVEKIDLLRDIVVVEETFARAALFSVKGEAAPMGYIYLPGFYNDFSGKTKRNAADDVRQAVLQLKNAGMSGLVLDLRGNGGGSLDDAIRISGLFIDQGPVLQVKNRQQGVKVYTDPEAGSIYDGPMIVLIDAVSASASEIVAAALQDYRRAIVIGGKQTFGKGTVQIMLDLDEFLRDNLEKIKPLGALKMTVQTFYRVNGDTNQFKGVIPDIILPASNDYLKVGERYYDYPIKPQVIDPALYAPLKRGFDLDRIKALSRERTASSHYFQQINGYIEILKKRQQNSTVSLEWSAFFANQENERSMIDRFKIPDQEVRFSIAAMDTVSQADGDRLARERKISLDNWIKDLRGDAYVEEAMLVLRDILDTRGN